MSLVRPGGGNAVKPESEQIVLLISLLIQRPLPWRRFDDTTPPKEGRRLYIRLSLRVSFGKLLRMSIICLSVCSPDNCTGEDDDDVDADDNANDFQ